MAGILLSSVLHTVGGTGTVLPIMKMKCKSRRGLTFRQFHQILAERSVAGWKEIEYEVMRDMVQITASSYVIWKI